MSLGSCGETSGVVMYSPLEDHGLCGTDQGPYSSVCHSGTVDVVAALSFTERPLQFCVCPCGTGRHKGSRNSNSANTAVPLP
jgi:hypothetical protein